LLCKQNIAKVTLYTYDALDRVTAAQDAMGEVSLFKYNALGQLVQSIDRENRATTATYDALGRRLTSTDALNQTTHFAYTLENETATITDPENKTTSYSYDSLGRLVTTAYENGQTRTQTYDKNGNTQTQTDTKGNETQTVSFLYDDLNRLPTRTYPDETQSFSYDSLGRLATAINPARTLAYQYDTASRLTQETQGAKSVQYAYSTPSINQLSVTYSDTARQIRKDFDLRNRLTGLYDLTASATVASFSHNLANRTTGQTQANGVETAYTHNANGWKMGISATLNGNTLVGLEYVRNKEGLKLSETKTDAPNRSEKYTLDALHRLTEYRQGLLVNGEIPNPTEVTNLALDSVGNFTSVTRNGIAEARTHGDVHEIETIGSTDLTHDFKGNQTDDTTYLYSWSGANLLREVRFKVDNSLVGRYQYDALGRRAWRLNPPSMGDKSR